MSNEVLILRLRKLNWLLSQSTVGYVSFDELCRVMAEMLDSNVYVLSRNGKVLASVRKAGGGSPMVETEGRTVLPKKYNDNLLKISSSRINLTIDDVRDIYGDEYDDDTKFHLIEPVENCGTRIGTMLFARPNEKFNEEDDAICELGATIVGMEIAKGLAEEEKEDDRFHNIVNMAIDKLSYSELKAVVHVFEELEMDDDLLVASKIADKYNITRSVIVNALRKLETAGVIETRSLGMKGTRIKVLNSFLRLEINKIDLV